MLLRFESETVQQGLAQVSGRHGVALRERDRAARLGAMLGMRSLGRDACALREQDSNESELHHNAWHDAKRAMLVRFTSIAIQQPAILVRDHNSALDVVLGALLRAPYVLVRLGSEKEPPRLA